MKTIMAISGSLRSESKNSIILEALKNHFSGTINIEIYDGMGTLPHFNPDIEFENANSVLAYRDLLKKSDAVLICTPEYAHGIPGSLKNALDWVVGSGELINKKMALLYSSSSEEQFVLEHLFEVLKTMSADVKRERCLKISGGKISPEIFKLIENLIDPLS